MSGAVRDGGAVCSISPPCGRSSLIKLLAVTPGLANDPSSGPPEAGSTLPAVTQLPEKPTVDGLEAKWRARWEADGTYRFDRTKTRDEVFSIDTPPPTVSGTLHP